jgi:hypothetical protein
MPREAYRFDVFADGSLTAGQCILPGVGSAFKGEPEDPTQIGKSNAHTDFVVSAKGGKNMQPVLHASDTLAAGHKHRVQTAASPDLVASETQGGMESSFSVAPPSPVLSQVAQAVANDMDNVLHVLRCGWPHNRRPFVKGPSNTSSRHSADSEAQQHNEQQSKAAAPLERAEFSVAGATGVVHATGKTEVDGCLPCTFHASATQAGPLPTETKSDSCVPCMLPATSTPPEPLSKQNAQTLAPTAKLSKEELQTLRKAAEDLLNGKSSASCLPHAADSAVPSDDMPAIALSQEAVQEYKGAAEVATQTQCFWVLTRAREGTHTGAGVALSRNAEAQTDHPPRVVICMHAAAQAVPEEILVTQSPANVVRKTHEQHEPRDQLPSMPNGSLSPSSESLVPITNLFPAATDPGVPTVDATTMTTVSSNPIPDLNAKKTPLLAAGIACTQSTTNPSNSSGLQGTSQFASQPSSIATSCSPCAHPYPGPMVSLDEAELDRPASAAQAAPPEPKFHTADLLPDTDISAVPEAQNLIAPTSSPPLPQVCEGSPDQTSSTMADRSDTLCTAIGPPHLPPHLHLTDTPKGLHFVYVSRQQGSVAFSLPQPPFLAEDSEARKRPQSSSPNSARPRTPMQPCSMERDDLIDLSSRPASGHKASKQAEPDNAVKSSCRNVTTHTGALVRLPPLESSKRGSHRLKNSLMQAPVCQEEASVVGGGVSELSLMPWHSSAADPSGDDSSTRESSHQADQDWEGECRHKTSTCNAPECLFCEQDDQVKQQEHGVGEAKKSCRTCSCCRPVCLRPKAAVHRCLEHDGCSKPFHLQSRCSSRAKCGHSEGSGYPACCLTSLGASDQCASACLAHMNILDSPHHVCRGPALVGSGVNTCHGGMGRPRMFCMAGCHAGCCSCEFQPCQGQTWCHKIL